MSDQLKIKMYAFTLDCQDPCALARFYASLLGWEIAYHDGDWAIVGPPGAAQGSYPSITFQREPSYTPPGWPAEPDAQQQMAHLDFAVNDLDGAVAHALQCGATVAAAQFDDGWRVMLDPAGHPFCLCQMRAVIESPQFGLR